MSNDNKLPTVHPHVSDDEAIRLAHKIEADRREREAARQRQRAEWAEAETERRFKGWLKGIKAQFRAEVDADWDRSNRPEWTFAEVGAFHTKERFDDAFRPEALSALARVHEARPLPAQAAASIEPGHPCPAQPHGQLTAGGWRK